jgi:hypothetical protein
MIEEIATMSGIDTDLRAVTESATVTETIEIVIGLMMIEGRMMMIKGAMTGEADIDFLFYGSFFLGF